MPIDDGALLPEEARAAWQAYQEMGKSKTQYFNFLQELDQKYKEGGSPSIAENLRLEELLKVHDKNVTAFSQAMNAVENKEAREALLQKLGSTNTTLGKH
ncbi:MAG: hypothetical protein HY356_03915 [Gammaproteobacteria bacterium]|nr:hypothetical protein [Gammaproteobacteria bacterium]